MMIFDQNKLLLFQCRSGAQGVIATIIPILTVTMVNVGIMVKVLEDAVEDLTGKSKANSHPARQCFVCHGNNWINGKTRGIE